VPETGSAGAQETGRASAGRDRSAGLRRKVVGGAVGPAAPESRKAEDVSVPMSFARTLASVSFMDAKPRGLTSGISGERSESAACRG